MNLHSAWMRPTVWGVIGLVCLAQIFSCVYFWQRLEPKNLVLKTAVLPSPCVADSPSNNDPFLDEEERTLHRDWIHHIKQNLATKGRVPDPYLFVHIAKTAGTSLVKGIGYAPEVEFSHFWHRDEKTVRVVTAKKIPEGKVHIVGGHLCHGIHRWWESENRTLSDYTYFTFLRDPIKRVMSHYRYHLNPRDPSHELTEGRTFVEWATQIRFAQNVMTAYMAGSEHYAWWNEGHVPLLPKQEPFPGYVLTEQHYRIARRNLITSIVGLQEDFDESVRLLNHVFNLQVTPIRENVGDKSSYDFDEKERAVVIAMNHWDIELYKLGIYLHSKLKELL